MIWALLLVARLPQHWCLCCAPRHPNAGSWLGGRRRNQRAQLKSATETPTSVTASFKSLAMHSIDLWYQVAEQMFFFKRIILDVSGTVVRVLLLSVATNTLTIFALTITHLSSFFFFKKHVAFVFVKISPLVCFRSTAELCFAVFPDAPARAITEAPKPL
jgi:hypothetical protein